MKPTKHIEKLAAEICKADPYADLNWTIKHLTNFAEALVKGRYYTAVESVSRSGMSRTIAIAIIKNNELHGAPGFIYKLAGCDKNRRISGCGMDMLFAAQYNLFRALCPGKRYQDSMKRYNSL
jgi:hypothetical protein